MLLDAGGRDGVLPGVALLQILAVLTVLAMGRRVARIRSNLRSPPRPPGFAQFALERLARGAAREVGSG
jgi:hypothetical protein